MVLVLNWNQNKPRTRTRIPVPRVLGRYTFLPLFHLYGGNILISLEVMLYHSAAVGLGEWPAAEQFRIVSCFLCMPLPALYHVGGCLAACPYSELITRWGSTTCDKVWGVLQQAGHKTLLPVSLVAAPGPADCN